MARKLRNYSGEIAQSVGNIRRDGIPHLIRADGWQNSYTGLGTSRDKTTQGSYWAPYRLQDSELIALFNGSDIAAKVCETKPQEMMRNGYEIEVDGKAKDGKDVPTSGELADLVKYGKKLHCNERLTMGGIWGNCFGGALLVIGAQDGLSMDKPLVEKSIASVRYLNVIDRRFITVADYYADQLQPNYGEPMTYQINSSISGIANTVTQKVHESRVIRFDGATTDILTRQQLAGWSWSLLQRVYDQLRAFEGGYQAVYNLVSDASQAVFKIQNLISMIASGNKEDLQTRMALVDMSRSVCRAVLIDAEAEEFERTTTSFAGLPDLLDRFMMRVSAAVGIPVSILLGRSAAGMNATGDNDFRGFYDKLGSEQTNHLAPKLAKLYHLFALAKDGPIARDIEFKIKFAPLWTSTAAEEADVRLKTSQADTAYLTAGVLTPEEVKASRWGKGQYSTETQVDANENDADSTDKKMFKSMLEPPAELMGRTGPQANNPPTPGMGGVPAPQDPQAPIGAAASPFGQSKNPVQVMKTLHDVPKPVKPGP